MIILIFIIQLIVIEKRNADGTWPRSPTGTPQQNQQAPSPPKTFNEVMMALRGLNKQAIETKGSLLSPTAASAKQRKKPKSITAQQEKKNVVQQSESIDRQSDEYRLTIASLEKTNSELNRSVHEKQDRITELEQEATTVQHQLVEAQGQLTEARQEASQSRSQLTEARQEANQAQRQLVDVRQEASQSRSQLTEAQQEANQAQRQLANVRQEASQSRSQLTAARQEANQAQRQLANVRQEASQSQSQLTEARQEANQAQRQLAEAQHQAEEAHQRADDIEHDLRDAEHRLTTSDRVFQDVLQRIMGHIPQSQPFWVVQRAEVTLTDEEIDTGGWASVKVAIFRGQRVAAKCLHPQIVSAHNIRLFTREMNMAAQARHPNLLQFVGAVMEGTPIILTELLPTSLRCIMEQGTRLTRQQIVSISCDVA